MNINEVNVLVLAYMGDSVYENIIRRTLINKKISNVKDLQESAVEYVSAKMQREILMDLINNNVLLEDELSIMKRARNCKVNHHPKNCDVITYNYSTAFEAVIGYLYLLKRFNRIDLIMKSILGDSYDSVW